MSLYEVISLIVAILITPLCLIIWYFLRLPFPIRVFLAYDSFCG